MGFYQTHVKTTCKSNGPAIIGVSISVILRYPELILSPSLSSHTHMHSRLGNEYISHIIILPSPSLSLTLTHAARSSKPIHHFPSRVCLLSSSVRRGFMKHQHSPGWSPLPEHRVQTMSPLWVLDFIYLCFHFMNNPQPHLTLSLMGSLKIG